MSAELAPEPEPERALCEWATCDGVDAEPGSLYCHQHGRQARLEGAPWRRPGAPVERRAEAVTHRRVDASGELAAGAGAALFTAPPATRRPSSPPAEAPAAASCRRCDEPALAKTLSAKPNRWSNLCEAHYTEARRNALGSRRREQIAAVLPAGDPAPPPGDPPVPGAVQRYADQAVAQALAERARADEAELSYTDRAAQLVELGANVDAAREQLAAALAAWQAAIADLA